ncbi:hypothetical protein HUS23_09365 [Ectothiorhodospiraceae bacterium 2226]|nr:hypothetical protein HUS23_09365 [Ectothiorhodospiraceae bacterium 2226]
MSAGRGDKLARLCVWTLTGALGAALSAPAWSQSFPGGTHLRADPEQVRIWNAFAEDVHALHERVLQGRAVRAEERIGGYGGPNGDPEYYRELRFYDADSGALLTWIQWERENPDKVHAVHVNVYDEAGVLERNYYAGFLPYFRNAPVQTLINLFAHNGALRAFRQFDASARRVYEFCEGRFEGEAVTIDIENFRSQQAVMQSDAYRACFEGVPTRVGDYLDPLAGY